MTQHAITIPFLNKKAKSKSVSRGMIIGFSILSLTSKTSGSSIQFLTKKLGVHERTVYRKIKDLEDMGCKFDKPFIGRYKLQSMPDMLRDLITNLSQIPITNADNHE